MNAEDALEVATRISTEILEEAENTETALRLVAMILSILIGSGLPPDQYDTIVDNLAENTKKILAKSKPLEKYRM